MTKDKKGNPTLPKWDFSKLKEIYVDGVRTSYIRMYNYKETKKKGQKQWIFQNTYGYSLCHLI